MRRLLDEIKFLIGEMGYSTWLNMASMFNYGVACYMLTEHEFYLSFFALGTSLFFQLMAIQDKVNDL